FHRALRPDFLVTASIETFSELEIRAGTVVTAEPFPGARTPAFRLTLDFGLPVGVLQSSAQLTRRYAPTSPRGEVSSHMRGVCKD
ncbi:MAG: hypothetical protein WD075_06070, partial [Rhodospirillales bacterium]